MRAMVQEGPGQPLTLTDIPVPEPAPGQALIKVDTCAVCRTDLHVVDGELPAIPYPVIPGHQVVGNVLRATAEGLTVGERVGAFPGWATPAVTASTASRSRKISATRHVSPAIPCLAATPNTWPSISATVCLYRRSLTAPPSHRCYAAA